MLLVLAKSADYGPEERIVKIPVGIYTQKQLLYQAIAILEKEDGEIDCTPQECIKKEFRHLRFKTRKSLNYARFCAFIKDKDKMAVYNMDNEVKYLIWIFEKNQMPVY